MNPEQLSVNDTESGHQKALFAHANNMGSYQINAPIIKGVGVAALFWMHANANGGNRDQVTAARMKAEGVKRGIPDIFLPYPTDLYCGLYIELKKVGKSSVSIEQSDFGIYALSAGYMFGVCKGWKEARYLIQTYLTDGRKSA